MSRTLHKFLDWWKDAPFYFSMWFIPFVAILFVIAFIKNLITGDTKWQQ